MRIPLASFHGDVPLLLANIFGDPRILVCFWARISYHNPKVRNLKSFQNSKKPGHTLRLAQYLSVAVSGEPEALVTEARVPLVS